MQGMGFLLEIFKNKPSVNKQKHYGRDFNMSCQWRNSNESVMQFSHIKKAMLQEKNIISALYNSEMVLQFQSVLD